MIDLTPSRGESETDLGLLDILAAHIVKQQSGGDSRR